MNETIYKISMPGVYIKDWPDLMVSDRWYLKRDICITPDWHYYIKYTNGLVPTTAWPNVYYDVRFRG